MELAVVAEAEANQALQNIIKFSELVISIFR